MRCPQIYMCHASSRHLLFGFDDVCRRRAGIVLGEQLPRSHDDVVLNAARQFVSDSKVHEDSRELPRREHLESISECTKLFIVQFCHQGRDVHLVLLYLDPIILVTLMKKGKGEWCSVRTTAGVANCVNVCYSIQTFAGMN